MRLRDHIAELVNEDRRNGWHGSIRAVDITKVEVRRGCAEIEVHFTDGDGRDDVATVDAAPVLTRLLQSVLAQGDL